MKRILVTCLVVLSFFAPRCFAVTNPAQVFVLGTIHGSHVKNKNYTYHDVIKIIATYHPDILCVEIRPKDFRKVANLYPSEMIMATVYGIESKIDVLPIDWYLDEALREKRNLPSFWQTDEGKRKREEFGILRRKSAIIQKYEPVWLAAFGSGKSEQSPLIKPDFHFVNSKEMQEYRREWYSLSEQVFGDSPVNAYYRERNQKMLALIEGVVIKNPGKKIMVITGADHKHFFDEGLKSNPNALVFDIEKLPPLKDVAFSEEFRIYAEQALVPASYFESAANVAVKQVQ